MFRKTKIGHALMLALGGALLPAAVAQRVEITGSSIRQISSESSLPVTVLKTEDLAKAGVTNAEQAMAFITSNQSSVNTASSVAGNVGGASFADLRGLGAGRTLVLVNGKRMVANSYDSGGDTAVDLNTIPYGAVERIEVLNDGASAIYGSDAVAGVVNFITRREYQGLMLNGSLSQPFSSGGGGVYDIGATAGVGSLTEQGWNLFGSVAYRWQNALPSQARSFARTGNIPSRGVELLSSVTFPSTYYQGNFSYNPSLPGCQPPSSLPLGTGTDATCNFDYSAYNDLIPKQEQLSALVKGSYAVDQNNTLSLEFLQGNNTVTTRVAPTAVFTDAMPTSNPFFPGGPGLGGVAGTPANTSPNFDPLAPIDFVDWRTTVAGSRQNKIESKTDRFLLDWVGAAGGWDYSVAALQSSSDIKNIFQNGYVNSTNMLAGVSGTPTTNGQPAPWLNPFGAQTAEGLAYIQAQQITGLMQRSEGTLRGMKADASSQIYKLPAGPLTMAVGLEYYRDTVSITNDLNRIAEAAGSGLTGAQDSWGSRNWTGLFAEFNIPVIKELELNLALRYDNYSDFGSTTNPKASLRWTPTKDLLLRGSYNTGFRAPSLYNVYSKPQLTNSQNAGNDPVLCPGGQVNTAAGGIEDRDCGAQFETTLGGNDQLQPESSTAWSAGLVFQPNASLLLSVDYWNYVVDDSIGNVGESVILQNPDKYGDLIVRCSDPRAQSGDYRNCRSATATSDPIAYIINTTTNLGTYKTSGLDFAASWRSSTTTYGRFSFGWQGTYVLQYEYQLEAGGAYQNNLGRYFNLQAISRYRQVMNFGWQQDEWAANLINRYSRGYTDQNGDGTYQFNTVGSVNTWDLALTWTGVKNAIISAGVTNLFNQDPPFSNQSDGPPTGYDYRYANPIGRAFLLRATYTF